MLKRITREEAKRRYYAKEPLYYCDPDTYAGGDVKYTDNDDAVIPVVRYSNKSHFHELVRGLRMQPDLCLDIVWLSGEECETDECREDCLFNWTDNGARKGVAA